MNTGSSDCHEEQSERARLVQEASELRQRLDFLMRIANHGMLVVNPEGQIVEWSQGAEDLFEFTSREILGKPLTSLFTATEADRLEQELALAGKEPGQLRALNLVWRRKQGADLNLDVSLTCWGAAASHRMGVVVQDITKQFIAQRRLQETEKNWRDVASNSSDVLLLLDRSGTIVFANRALSDLHLHELIGANAVELFPSEQGSRLRAGLQQVFEGGAPVAYELQRNDRDGNPHWLWCRLAPQREDGDVVQAVLSLTDLTERRAHDQALKRLAAIVTGTSEAVISADAAGLVTTWNQGAEALFGWTEAEAVGRHASFLASDGGTEEQARYFASLKDGGKDVLEYEAMRLTKEGRQVPVAVTTAALRNEAGLFEGSSAVLRDLSRQRELQTALEQAKAAAETTSRLKGEFLANMSHEIRTPLNGVVGMAELLGATRLSAEQRGYLATLDEACQTLRVVVDDILDFSKIEAGQLSIERVDFDLKALLQGTVNMFQPAAERAGTVLSLKFPDTAPRRLLGDPHRIRQVLMNLTSNAVKFTAAGTVDVRIGTQDTEGGRVRLRVEVADTGVGISPEARARIFQPFAQADGSITRRFGGTGLGLAISRKLLELMGGTLGLTSSPGVGSRFWFELDLELATTEGVRGIRKPSSGFLQASRAWKLLVAEDNAINRQVLSAMLRGLSCEVDLVQNGREAVKHWQERAYDAILMDCQMPELSGFDATIEIRRQEKPGERVPIIAITAQAYAEDRERCERAGMDDHLAKPITRSSLKAILSKWLQLESRLPAPLISRQPAVASIDRDALTLLLRELGEGGDRVLIGLVESFLAEFPPAERRLRGALAARDAPRVVAEAHHLRSSTGSLAALGLSTLCQRLELLARKGDLSSCMPLMAEVELEFSAVTRALRDYIARLPGALPGGH